jgi:hypothetical protein
MGDARYGFWIFETILSQRKTRAFNRKGREARKEELGTAEGAKNAEE